MSLIIRVLLRITPAKVAFGSKVPRDVVVVGLCRRALDKCPGGQAVQNVTGQISGDRRLVKEADGVRIGSVLEQVVLDSE